MLARRIQLREGQRLADAAAIARLIRVYIELERFVLERAGDEIRQLRRDLHQLKCKTGAHPMAAPQPGAQLAALVKSAKSGGLRAAVTRAVGSLTDGHLAFDDLNGTLAQYEEAVQNAKALAAFVRQELQAETSNGGPAIGEVVKIATGDVGSVADVLGNFSASLQPPAAGATGAAAGSQEPPPSPPVDNLADPRASSFSSVHPSLRTQNAT
jgi:hypothetical protein